MCGCINGRCRNCNAFNFLGHDEYNNGRKPNFTLISSVTPNTTNLTCTSSDVEIQVRKYVKLNILVIYRKKKFLFKHQLVFWHVWLQHE